MYSAIKILEYCKCTLEYQIVVVHKINIVENTFLNLNNSGGLNNRGGLFLKPQMY